jgi:hypothetical protein
MASGKNGPPKTTNSGNRYSIGKGQCYPTDGGIDTPILEVVVHDIDEATGAFEATLGAAGTGMPTGRPADRAQCHGAATTAGRSLTPIGDPAPVRPGSG